MHPNRPPHWSERPAAGGSPATILRGRDRHPVLTPPAARLSLGSVGLGASFPCCAFLMPAQGVCNPRCGKSPLLWFHFGSFRFKQNLPGPSRLPGPPKPAGPEGGIKNHQTCQALEGRATLQREVCFCFLNQWRLHTELIKLLLPSTTRLSPLRNLTCSELMTPREERAT